MGIEPTRKAAPDLENKQLGTMVNAKCDGRVNFRGMRGHVGHWHAELTYRKPVIHNLW